MIKEYYYRDMGCFSMTHPFAEERSYGYHRGIDWYSHQAKNQDIYNLVDGVIEFYGEGRDEGLFILLRHDPSFANGIKCNLYSVYYHLSEIDDIIFKIWNSPAQFIQAGEIIGKMGNTGYCLTKGLTGWRKVNAKERSDKNSKKGVHLHQGFYQITEDQKETELIKEMKKVLLMNSVELDYFFYKNRIYINPNKIMEYFKFLRNKI